jgi:hypothetical protein
MDREMSIFNIFPIFEEIEIGGLHDSIDHIFRILVSS